MSEQGSVTYAAMERAAKRLFCVWSGDKDVEWGRTAWDHLDAQGLITYASDAERVRVLARLAALAALYSEFTGIAFDEPAPPEYGEWVHYLDLDRDTLLHTAPGNFEDTYTGAGRALSALVEAELPAVYYALVDGYGSIHQLFVWLWLSPQDEDSYRWRYVEERWDEDKNEWVVDREGRRTDADIETDVLNEAPLIGNKMPAYEHVTRQAKRYLERYDPPEYGQQTLFDL